MIITYQAAAASIQKQDGLWLGVVAGGGGGVNAVQVYDPIENKWTLKAEYGNDIINKPFIGVHGRKVWSN